MGSRRRRDWEERSEARDSCEKLAVRFASPFGVEGLVDRGLLQVAHLLAQEGAVLERLRLDVDRKLRSWSIAFEKVDRLEFGLSCIRSSLPRTSDTRPGVREAN